MTFVVGNQFWKLRSKHGRDRLFATPELMWEAACEYFQWCIDNPLIEIDYRGKELEQVQLPKMRPFTYQGLCGYLDCNTVYFAQFRKDCPPDFSKVISRIDDVLYQQKFEGAASGFLNPNIIARDLGLADKSAINHQNNGESFDKKTDEQLLAELTAAVAKLSAQSQG